MATRWMRWNDTSHIFEYSTDGVTFNVLPLDASILTQGTIDPARIPGGGGGASTSANNVWTGQNQYSGTAPNIQFNDTDQGANLKNWDIGTDAGLFRLRTLNDALASPATLFSLDRSGNLIVTPTGAGAHSFGNNFNGANALQLSNQNAGASAYAELYFRNNSGDNRGSIRFPSSAWTGGAAFQPDALNLFSAGVGGLNLNVSGGPILFQTANTSRMSISLAGLIKTLFGFEIGADWYRTGTIAPAALSTQQDNWAPTGFATASVIRQQLTANVTITGIAGGAAGRIITICNFGGFQLTLAELSGSSTAANQIVNPGGSATVIPNGGSATLWYDGTNSFWRVIAVALGSAASGAARVQVWHNGTDNVATGSFVTIAFNAEDIDSAGFHDNTTNNSRLTVPSGQGGDYYIWGMTARAGGPSAGRVDIRVIKNGGSTGIISNASHPAVTGQISGGTAFSGMATLAAGDYVEMQIQSTVTASAWGSTTRDQSHQFGMFRVA